MWNKAARWVKDNGASVIVASTATFMIATKLIQSKSSYDLFFNNKQFDWEDKVFQGLAIGLILNGIYGATFGVMWVLQRCCCSSPTLDEDEKKNHLDFMKGASTTLLQNVVIEQQQEKHKRRLSANPSPKKNPISQELDALSGFIQRNNLGSLPLIGRYLLPIIAREAARFLIIYTGWELAANFAPAYVIPMEFLNYKSGGAFSEAAKVASILVYPSWIAFVALGVIFSNKYPAKRVRGTRDDLDDDERSIHLQPSRGGASRRLDEEEGYADSSTGAGHQAAIEHAGRLAQQAVVDQRVEQLVNSAYTGSTSSENGSRSDGEDPRRLSVV